MKYEEPVPISRAAAQSAFRSGDTRQIRDALVRSALHDPDYLWVEERCLEYLRHPDSTIRKVAATSLGHLGRIHGSVTVERVVPALNELLRDPEVGGTAQDALDDLKRFVSSVP